MVFVRSLPDEDVPRTRRKNVLGFRVACESVFGKGAFEQTLAALPPHVRDPHGGLVPVEEWIPEAFLIAWYEALWLGPARQDEAVMRSYVAATVVNGFGRVRRFLLRSLTPEGITARASTLWREEHSSGRLEAQLVRPGRSRVRLHDHPYIETPLMRTSLAEALRVIVGLTRAKNVTEKHAAYGAPLVIELAWDVSP